MIERQELSDMKRNEDRDGNRDLCHDFMRVSVQLTDVVLERAVETQISGPFGFDSLNNSFRRAHLQTGVTCKADVLCSDSSD